MQILSKKNSAYVHAIRCLRDIEACLGAQPAKLYQLGFRGNITRSNLADANESRDWRIYCEFAHALIRTARRLYTHDALAHGASGPDSQRL